MLTGPLRMTWIVWFSDRFPCGYIVVPWTEAVVRRQGGRDVVFGIGMASYIVCSPPPCTREIPPFYGVTHSMHDRTCKPSHPLLFAVEFTPMTQFLPHTRSTPTHILCSLGMRFISPRPVLPFSRTSSSQRLSSVSRSCVAVVQMLPLCRVTFTLSSHDLRQIRGRNSLTR